ncbi:MAG: cupin domain-containing protein [Cocleimonas sp.]|nr:cupin domain-containing protein [Cocleimonas sp.]
MEKPRTNTQTNALDNDVLDLLLEAHTPSTLSLQTTDRMRTNVMQKIREQKAFEEKQLIIVREGKDGWIDALPGAQIKILRGEISVPNSLLSYLVRLESGFTLAGHEHPFDEEILMLEGDLSLGGLTLSAGDFHFAAMGTKHGDVSTLNGCLAYMRGILPI